MIKLIIYFFGFCFLISAGIVLLPFYIVYLVLKTLWNHNIESTSKQAQTMKQVPITEKEIQFQNDSMNKNTFAYKFTNIYDGNDFEYFCSELLSKNGFKNIVQTPHSNDFGVDIVAENSDHVKYAFQCKYYSSSLGNTPIQEVSAGMAYYGCHVGVVITNSNFTKNAIALAEKANILLWDHTKLKQLIEQADK